MAYLPDLPYQEGIYLAPILEESSGNTVLVDYNSDEISTNRNVFMVEVVSDDDADNNRYTELPQDISADEATTYARFEDDHFDARRRRNQRRAQ